MDTPAVKPVPGTRLLLAPCCHDSIDLDPPDTEYLMVRVRMALEFPAAADKYIDPDRPTQLPSSPHAPVSPYVDSVEVEQPYHTACLKAGRGLREGVSYEQISVPGPLGTRRLATRKELGTWPQS